MPGFGTVGYLLDTNVLSALRHPRRHPRVAASIARLPPSLLFTSALCVGELQRGLLAKQRRTPSGVAALERWVDEAEARFSDRVLVIDLPIAKVWSELTVERSRSLVDTLLAATCIVHNLTFVTRNTDDVLGLPLSVWNPWQS